jgi:predicted dehydrogenase
MALRRRVVVAGLGSIGRRHARLLREREDVSVEVVEPADQARAMLWAELGAELPVHASYAAAVDSSPDIVWICTPTRLHADQTIAALNAGLQVFSEKPMADVVAAALRMEEAANRARGVLDIGFYLHFWHAMQELKRRLTAGDLGQLLHAHARVGTYITLVNSISRYQAANPGSLFFDYSHQPDLLYWLTGMAPRAVTATAFQAGALEFSSDPNVADIVCEYDAPLVTSIHLNYVQMPQRHYYEFVGDEAWAVLDFETKQMTVGRRRSQAIETFAFPQERDDMFRAEHRAFFDAVDGKRGPETSATDGVVSTAICEAILESVRRKGRVEVALPGLDAGARQLAPG